MAKSGTKSSLDLFSFDNCKTLSKLNINLPKQTTTGRRNLMLINASNIFWKGKVPYNLQIYSPKKKSTEKQWCENHYVSPLLSVLLSPSALRSHSPKHRQGNSSLWLTDILIVLIISF